MVLLIAIGAAAVAYQNKQQNEGGADGEGGGGGSNHSLGGSSASSPSKRNLGPDLSDKTAVDLLPLERSLGLFEAPISTITFMDGNPAAASSFLEGRVKDIVRANPWLGGWLGREKLGGRVSHGAVKLYYDPTGEDLCGGLFQCYDADTVKLTRTSPVENHGEIFETHEVKVKCNALMVNACDSPLWKVAVIPDAEHPTSRFALVISMSHMLGDGHTFFRLKDMLHTSGEVAPLNPKRKHRFGVEAAAHMGKDEVYYVDRVSRSPVWAKWGKGKPDETIIETKVFYINKEWVEGQKEAAEKVALAEAAAALDAGEETTYAADAGLDKISEDDAAGGDDAEEKTDADAGLVKISEDDNDADAEKVADTDSRPPPTTKAQKRDQRGQYAVSFAAKTASLNVTTNDIITCAFFKQSNATVGLMPYDFRGRPGMSCDINDAGNYSAPIPYTDKDFLSPLDIKASRQTARRVWPTALPPHKQENKYAISVDWRSFQRQGGLTVGSEDGEQCKQVLQLPCYDTRSLKAMPKSFSFVTLFNAGPHGEPAISIMASREVMQEIEKSGMVTEQLFASAGTSEDAFATTVAETAAGRRQSVFAPLIASHATSIADLEDMIGEDERIGE